MNSDQNAAPMQIALDGPSASGKTTIGTMLAERLEVGYLDTGLMYRAVTFVALKRSVSLADEDELTAIAEDLEFEVRHQGGRDWRLIVDGEDLTDRLHTKIVNRYVPQVSAISHVRQALVRQQRAIADHGPIVMAGRDIGTVVLANAPVKIYLNASVETRALRRAQDDKGNIDRQEYGGVLNSLRRRDEIDSNREDSPLRPAVDAKIVDNESSTPEEIVEGILSMIGASETVEAS